MGATQSETVAIGGRLPSLRLRTDSGQTVDLRRSRNDSLVLVLAHADCDDCVAYLDGLAEVADALGALYARPIVVAADEDRAGSLADGRGLAAAADPEGRLRTQTGIDVDTAAVLVADRYGVVYRCDVAERNARHDFVAPGDLPDETRYIGSQCPECGVPDDPLRGEDAWTL